MLVLVTVNERYADHAWCAHQTQTHSVLPPKSFYRAPECVYNCFSVVSGVGHINNFHIKQFNLVDFCHLQLIQKLKVDILFAYCITV